MFLTNLLRSIALVAGAVFMAATAVAPLGATTVFDFTGVCTAIGSIPCSGTARGTLTLTDGYVPGTSINTSEFVSFVYYSTGVTPVYTIDFNTYSFVNGNIPLGGGPAAFDVADGVVEFRSLLDGSWGSYPYVTGAYTLGEGGDTGAFTDTPEPSSVFLIGGSLAGLAALRRRKS